MKRILFACVGVVILCAPAFAEQTPAPGRLDPRMRYIAYNPNQVVRLSTAVGATLVVSFRPQETVTAVAVSDSKDLTAVPRENYLFFKSKLALPLQPVVVLTSSDSGTRRYVFDIVTNVNKDLGPDSPGIYYSVQFAYPEDVAAAQAASLNAAMASADAEWNAINVKRQFKVAQNNAQYPGAKRGNVNWHYVGQGDHSLLPMEVYDDGYSTVFRFPANTRVPSIFVINPDGKEATANYAVNGDFVTVAAVAAGWRLRDGNTVLCIWNHAYNPVGYNPGTETISPNINRVVKAPAP